MLKAKKNKPVRKVIFLGRKPGASAALSYLLENKVKVALVVADKEEKYNINLRDTAKKYGIKVIFDDKELYCLIEEGNAIAKDVDLVISYLYWRKIKTPLLKLSRLGCVNFHPAPLPEYKGRAGYNTAILDEKDWFGVSAHFIDSEDFDAGPIIKVLKFPLDQERETALSLEKKAQEKLLVLFRTILRLFITGKPIPTRPNQGGVYLNKRQLEELKQVNFADDPAIIDRKIRAFFFPPYSGATIKINGREFTLINSAVLERLRLFFD